MATPKVGKDIDAFCNKCKMVLNHVVVAKVGETVKRVKCLTCGSDHVYKNPAGATPIRNKLGLPGSRPKRAVAPKAADYDDLMKGRDLAKARKYKPGDTFVRNDLVNHTTFGFGVVLATKDGGKIEVIFKDSTKTLVHAMI